MKNIKLIEVRSEIGAGTRGASMGVDALKVACLNKQSDYFKRFNSTEVANLNYVLFDRNLFPFAKYIDSVLTVQKSIASTVKQTMEQDMFPLVLAGDHSNAAGTIAGIKAANRDKTLGVIWIDAHADSHSPYTTPSGNMHGMPLGIALNEDNLCCQINNPDPETLFFWNALKRIGGEGPKLKPEHLVYVMVRSTEEPENTLMREHSIKNYKYDEFNAKGPVQVGQEVLERLRDCDIIYVSFDVDSLDPKFSRGTGTPVAIGLTVTQAQELCYTLCQSPKVCCFEMVEINPMLDIKNTMAKNAFRILEAATEAILNQSELTENLG
ncbi:arginase [Adhaeribacter arboris]|uniref:Arginase n=1 Tax=Adhaeribacter arboris TaxID=2072846 RepID=A0A2T2YGB7_9BACT|nr:arginase [Adhaeribacter arboris]PSR54544.1 arginase [Adhaeribacter arboris]